jgi:hypothetical protein
LTDFPPMTYAVGAWVPIVEDEEPMLNLGRTILDRLSYADLNGDFSKRVGPSKEVGPSPELSDFKPIS